MERERSATFAARLTPVASAAIATIAVHGEEALNVVGRFFSGRRALRSIQIDDVRYGTWISNLLPASAEQVVICRTEELEIEIHCHGGAAVCQMILDDLTRVGCKTISARDWPSSGVDRIQLQAEADLQFAPTSPVASILLDQYRGSLSSELKRIVNILNASDTDTGLQRIDRLIETGRLIGRRCHPQRVCLTGPPNAGKSSLMNAIVGVRRSIVHDQPGTTRDTLETSIVLEGWPITVIDTAGIRPANDPIEQAGIDRARRELAIADLIVVVADATCGLDFEVLELVTEFAVPVIIAWNKTDISVNEPPLSSIPVARTSALSTAGVEPLLDLIIKQLFSGVHVEGSPVPFRSSHLEALQAVRRLILDQDCQAASTALALLTADGSTFIESDLE